MEIKKVNIIIDGKQFETLPDRNLLHACLALGFDIPHFCYHPALGSVGACRLCAVKKYRDQNDNIGRIVMSCMEPVTEGLVISIDDEEVRNFRKSVIEGLMINHPHDCPVCDEGGECHLQDMTMMTGHNYRRYRFPKRTYNNQYLGPFINHEMNRCIQCYRCVRFYRDYAGGNDLNVFGAHDHLYFGRAADGALESEFSGNLVEVCPTGVFTDKSLGRHYSRKWDMTNAPSICINCSVGCNTIVSERYGRVTRILSRYNGSVNGHFLCDRGRFGYEFVNDGNRIRNISIRSSRSNDFEVAGEELLRSTIQSFFPANSKVIGIGSPRASLESNFALSQLVGKENFYIGIGSKDLTLIKKSLQYLSDGGIYSPSLKDIEKADAVLILGEDLTNTAPMVALAVRQALRNASFEMASQSRIPLWQDDAVRVKGLKVNSPLFIVGITGDKLDDIATNSLRLSPQDIARFGFGIASLLNGKPLVDFDANGQELIQSIAGELQKAKNPLIVSGVHLRNEGIIDSAWSIAKALSGTDKKPSLCYVFPECNSVGSAMMESKPLDEAFNRVRNEDANTALILENDLYLRADKNEVDQFFEQCQKVIVLDHLPTATTSRADIVLPAATFAESTGTLVNNEGRAQRFYCALPGKFQVMDSWKWIGKISQIQRKEEIKEVEFGSVIQSLCGSAPIFKDLIHLSDVQGAKVLNERIARQTPRFSGRTAIRANISVGDERPPDDKDSPLVFSMEGDREYPPSSFVPYHWSPGWNSVQALYKYLDEPNGSLKGGDPGIRLLSTSNGKLIQPIEKIPLRYIRKGENLLIVPIYEIFGSEEMSSQSASIKERIPESLIYLNKEDADRISVEEDAIVNLAVADSQYAVKVKFTDLPEGVAGLYRRISEFPFLDLPTKGMIKLKR